MEVAEVIAVDPVKTISHRVIEKHADLLESKGARQVLLELTIEILVIPCREEHPCCLQDLFNSLLLLPYLDLEVKALALVGEVKHYESNNFHFFPDGVCLLAEAWVFIHLVVSHLVLVDTVGSAAWVES